jgi:hypothetical protein
MPIQCVLCTSERYRNWFLCLDHIYLYIGLSVDIPNPKPIEIEKLKTIAKKA